MNIIKQFNSILKDSRICGLLENLKIYHKETYEHSKRVGLLCMKLGIENNFSEEEIKLLCYSGLLHDLGKLDIPIDILDKKENLNLKEREKIEEHSRKGFLRMKDFEEIKEIVLRHHTYQLKKYPINLEKTKFDKLIQIVAVADMFDALSNERAYKKAFDKKKVEKILNNNFTGDKIYIEQVIDSADGENPRIKRG